MNLSKKTMSLAMLATVFMFVAQAAFAGTVTVQHGTLSATLGAPANFSYTPDWYVINDPTHTVGLGLQPYATLGSTLASVQCQGSADLSVSQNPGWNTLSLTPSSGTATMNLGLTAGLNIEFIAFGYTVQGSLGNPPDWGFYDSQTFSSYLLDTPVTLSGQISQNLVSLNTLDALTLEFGVAIPGWLAGINLNINGVANLDQTIQGANINTSAGAISSEGQSLNVYTSGTSFQLQNVQETWSDAATLSLGLGADMSADLLDGIVSVQLVNFGNVTLISASQTYQLQSSAIPTVSFDLSTGGGSSAPVITSVSPATLTGLPTGQTQLIRIVGSEFTSSSTLTFNDGVDAPFTDTVPTYISANELDYYISVGTNQADWSVQVVNGSQTSASAYFTVNAPSATPSGSLVVNLSPVGAVSAGAQWQVDGGSYYSSGGVVPVLTPGSHTISFKSVSGYTTPASQIVNITANVQTATSASYTSVAASTYTLTLNYNSVQGGASASPATSGNIYTAGANVQLYARASSGYHFTGWGGDLSGTNNPVNITMNGNKNITANFASGDPTMGTVIITIQPPAAATAGVTWGFSANDYRASGSSYTTYPATYFLDLHTVAGWIGPSTVAATLTAGQTTNVSVTFAPNSTPGLLTVTLSPQDVVTAGAQWHVNGGAYGNGTPVSLAPGNYDVTFDNVSNWTSPASQAITMQPSQTLNIVGNYTPAAGQPVIGGISPPIGSMTGGTTMTINGANFTFPAIVTVGGQTASKVSAQGSTQITCLAPASTNYGSASVVVETGNGSATNLNGFAYGFANGNKLNLLGSSGGSCYGVAVQGNYAYVGEGRSLLVLNVSSQSSPTKVAQVSLPGIVMDVALFGNYAYVADGEGGMQVVDISNPAIPQVSGYQSSTNYTWTAGITIFGGIAYVADQGAGLEVFNLANQTMPTLLSSTNVGGSAEDVVFQASTNGAFAYLTTGSSLQVVDVSNPLSPVLRGQTSIGNTYSIAISGNYVYAATASGSADLKVIDVSNPDSPTVVGSGPNVYFSVAVATGNNLVYAVSEYDGYGFYAYDISGSTLSVAGSLPQIISTGYGSKMVISGNYAYIASGLNGLQIVNIANAYNPLASASFTDSGLYDSYQHVAVTGNTLCASDGNNFKVFDVSHPAQPRFITSLEGAGGQVLAQNGIAYVQGSYGTEIINVSTPSNPELVATISNSVVNNFNMTFSGNTLFIAGVKPFTDQPRLVLADISTPSSPEVSSTYDFPSSGTACVAANGNTAVVGIATTAGQSLLDVLDVSNLSAPVELSSLTLTNISDLGVAMSSDGDYAYVIDNNNPIGLHIVNISNPANPEIATNLSLNIGWDSSLALQVEGNELYVNTSQGLYVYDIGNPVSPVLTRSYLMDEMLSICVPTDSGVQSGNIYVADENGGIVALQEQNIQAPSIYITNPTFSSTYTCATSTISLGGGSDDNVGVTAITWSNNRGGSGQISTPLDDWYVNDITLYPGTNVLTVTAFDAAGNSDADALTVDYQTTNQDQSITFPPISDQTFGVPPIQLVAAASSGLPITFNVVSGPAVLSASNVLALTGAGAVTVEADQSGNNGFNPATPVDMNFNVTRASQSIAFAPVPDHSAGDAPFTLTAMTSSGLQPYFSILSGPAIISSNIVTLLGGGAVTTTAWQPGNSNYNAAAVVQQSFNVSLIPQTIAFGALSQQKTGDASFSLAATASSGLPVTFSVSGAAELSGNILTLTGSGNVTVTASQPGNNTYAESASVAQSFFVVPPANTLASVGLLTIGFQMSFYGTIGSNYTLQASTDLKNWTSVLNFTCTNSPMIVIDPGAKYLTWRFYRSAQGTLP